MARRWGLDSTGSVRWTKVVDLELGNALSFSINVRNFFKRLLKAVKLHVDATFLCTVCTVCTHFDQNLTVFFTVRKSVDFTSLPVGQIDLQQINTTCHICRHSLSRWLARVCQPCLGISPTHFQRAAGYFSDESDTRGHFASFVTNHIIVSLNFSCLCINATYELRQ
jgi:hypothetical protein